MYVVNDLGSVFTPMLFDLLSGIKNDYATLCYIKKNYITLNMYFLVAGCSWEMSPHLPLVDSPVQELRGL